VVDKMQVGIIGGKPPFFYETPERLLELHKIHGKKLQSPKFRLLAMELQLEPGRLATTDTAFDLRFWKPSPPLPVHGKLAPSSYSSLPEYDLGLCKATFSAGNDVCELGADCPYRHQGLSKNEHQFLACLRNRMAANNLVSSWNEKRPVHEQTRWGTDKN
jgi:hypothetical protein